MSYLKFDFEADRITVSKLTGWTNWSNISTDPNGNTDGSHTPGRYALKQSNASAYQASVSQNLTVPNGTYSLSAWVKSSGCQKKANIYAKNFGGSEISASINSAIGSWKQMIVSDIKVTNGTILLITNPALGLRYCKCRSPSVEARSEIQHFL